MQSASPLALSGQQQVGGRVLHPGGNGPAQRPCPVIPVAAFLGQQPHGVLLYLHGDSQALQPFAGLTQQLPGNGYQCLLPQGMEHQSGVQTV